MKYVVVLYDGMADYPVDVLNDKTPMEVAKKPNLDKLARFGKMGIVKTVGDGLKPGSDIANMSVLGYNPKECYTGRSPLEALSIGVDMETKIDAFGDAYEQNIIYIPCFVALSIVGIEFSSIKLKERFFNKGKVNTILERELIFKIGVFTCIFIMGTFIEAYVCPNIIKFVVTNVYKVI